MGGGVMARPRARRAVPVSVRVVNMPGNVHRNVHGRNPTPLLGPVNVVNVVNVFPGSSSGGRARPRMRKGSENVHDVHDVHENRSTH